MWDGNRTRYASAFYGPFREALASAPREGEEGRVIFPNKKTYQQVRSRSEVWNHRMDEYGRRPAACGAVKKQPSCLT